MPLNKRNLFCTLATADSDWIGVNQWGWANGYSICTETTNILNSCYLCPVPFQVYLVVGSDHAYRHGLFAMNELVICIHRSQDGDQLKKAVKANARDNFIFVDGEPVEISSTLVRTLLKSKDWGKLSAILPAPVLEYFKTQ